MRTTDLLVVGGGPAGLATALAARRKGLDVVVADPARPPIDKACGEGLMPDALEALAQLGVTLEPEDGAVFRGIRFEGFGSSVEARFPRGVGIGIRRPRLHQILVDHAEAARVELRWGTPVALFSEDVAQVGEESLAFRYLAGADGANSTVRRLAGLDQRSHDGLRYGFRRHYRLKPWSDSVEVHWAPGCQIYITPVAADCICVALLARTREMRLDTALRLFPEVQRRLAAGEAAGAERGATSAFRRLRRVVRGRVALVGDASGSVDAVTGEGLSLAFREAAALAEAISRDQLFEYERSHRQIRDIPDRMASLLLLMDRSDLLCRRALRSMAARPRSFASMLAAHVGESSRTSIAAALCAVAWGLFTT